MSDPTTNEQAIALFDALKPVDIDFMIGSWKGEGFPTHHPLDGLLEAYHWHGKRFESAQVVHPLLFSARNGSTASVNPLWIKPLLTTSGTVPLPKSAALGKIFQTLLPLFSTSKSTASLRMTTYRGKTSASMAYHQLPVYDVFRKIDDDSVLGLMHLEGMKMPFFFLLLREFTATRRNPEEY